MGQNLILNMNGTYLTRWVLRFRQGFYGGRIQPHDEQSR